MGRRAREIGMILVLLVVLVVPAWAGWGGASDASLGQVSAPDAGGSWLTRIFSSDYMPRWMCMHNQADVVWTHVISDVIIAAAYYSIPVALVYFVRRRKDIVFGPIFYLFAIFILACGTTHVFNIIAIWQPFYRLDGIVKALTAGVSLLTAVVLWPLIPKALLLPSPSQLQLANAALQNEVSERARAESELRIATNSLEIRVQERTAELQRVNQELRQEVGYRREAEEAQARLAAIVESSADAIVGKGLDGIIHSWNAGAERIYGYKADEIIGRSIMTIVPPERQEEEREILVRLRRGEMIEHFETQRLRKDGTLVHVSTTFSPIKDRDGKIIGASKIARDITDQKAAEAERELLLKSEREARAEAERASRAKDEFLATLSHELRTPMNAILGWTQLLRRGKTVSPEDLAEALEIIERNTHIQVKLIEELLDMSRIISGKLRLDVHEVDLGEVIDAAIKTVTPAADAREIRIQRMIDSQVGPVMGDANRLQQVIWNLLSNAVKFTSKGGRVQIHLERVNSHVEIVVSDNGQGIAKDFLPYVFDRFRQEDSTSTRRHGGLGLGLAIVRHLVELHGGTVRAQSEGEGRGTTMTIALPKIAVRAGDENHDRAHPTVERGLPEMTAPSLVGISVLVVDDEPDSRELVRRLLESCGAKVLLAASAREALTMIRENRPTVLVSDIGMPEEDGYTLIKQVRALSQVEGGMTPAVALTAFARSEDRRRVLLSGFQMHLAKPADASELTAIVANLGGVMFKK